LAWASLTSAACGAADPAELNSAEFAETPQEPVSGAQQAVVAGCVRGESRQAVGDAYDVLNGRSGSFPFNDDYSACESTVGTTNTDMRFFSDSYEFERAASSGVSVDGQASFGAYSASASVKNKVESKIKFSRNNIIFMVNEEILKTKVTLDGGVPYSPVFEQYLATGDKLSLHNTFGDAFVKTAYLGHSMRLIFVAEVERTDKYRKQDFESVLKASYQAASVGGSVTVSGFSSTQVNEMTQKMRISVLAITRSPNIPEISEMTLGEVKGVLATFRSVARTNNGVTIREELVPFGQHAGKSETQFFDWRQRLASIETYERYYQQAKQISDLGTKFKNLTTRGLDGMAGAQWFIDQFRAPAGYQGSGSGAAAFGNNQYLLRLDADEYKQIVEQSQRLLANRQDGVCITVADGSAGFVTAQLAAKPCSNEDGQLFRYDTSTQLLRTVSGDCVDISGGSSVGGLVLATCGSAPDPKSQHWAFSVGSRKIDPYRTRDIHFVSNGFGTFVRAANNQSANAATWSRDDYREYSWHLGY
jgi:hypothetical protein